MSLSGSSLIVDYVKRMLIGPANGFDEVLLQKDPPLSKYISGILFPQLKSSTEQELLASEPLPESEADSEYAEGSPTDSSTSQSFYPSSASVSFLTDEEAALEIMVDAAAYLRQDDKRWRRVQVLSRDVVPAFRLAVGETYLTLAHNLSVHAKWRKAASGHLVTVSLVNESVSTDGDRDRNEKAFFQVSMHVRCLTGQILPYPSGQIFDRDIQEQVIELNHSVEKAFAIGHGSAVSWEHESDRSVAGLEMHFMPEHEVPRMAATATGFDKEISIQELSTAYSDPSKLRVLDELIDSYKKWKTTLRMASPRGDGASDVALQEIHRNIDECISRMERGLDLLRSNHVALLAFSLANQAMLLQMRQSAEHIAGGEGHPVGHVYEDIEFAAAEKKWYPFQIAFLLLTLEGVVDKKSKNRATVDVLWFPTGGGKTEAYLALLAFTCFYRRASNPTRGGGTAAITRYTLRLLTAQQFHRSATLICAMEFMRRSAELEGDRLSDLIGLEEFSIGLWVGGQATPNDFETALSVVQGKSIEGMSMQLPKCPWCGTLTRSDDGVVAWRADQSTKRIHLACLNDSCDFSDRIPVQTVDSEIYRTPPTLILATVDKFARFAWDAKPGVLFGTDYNDPPELVIQDEFHLITGPLGTIVGAYEAVFGLLMSREVMPKIVASSATVRNSTAQTMAIFGRSAFVFPPPGTSKRDSFFAQEDHLRKRKYVGFMPQGNTAITAMARLSAALLQANEEVDLLPPLDDAYFTLVAYHNSLRELSKTMSLIRDDIPFWMQAYSSRTDGTRKMSRSNIQEITSNLNSLEIENLFERLSKPKSSSDALDFVASTNMFSVGVDVQRLGLMLVSGQPKSLSEYIQATSRVGRSSSAPGLVFSLFSPMRTRDRSHFETFQALHSNLYQFVEHQSVTPFATEARRRVLHAGLVILARHYVGWAKDNQANQFDPSSPAWQEARNLLLSHVEKVDPLELDATRQDIFNFEQKWQAMIVENNGSLSYESRGRGLGGLLKHFGTDGPGIPTLNQMRSVDSETQLTVWKRESR